MQTHTSATLPAVVLQPTAQSVVFISWQALYILSLDFVAQIGNLVVENGTRGVY